MKKPSYSPKSILSTLRLWFKNRQAETQHVDYVVSTVEPRIATVSGYRRKLRAPIKACLEHCKSMVSTIPGPIKLKQSDYYSDPLIRAAFVGAVKIEDLLAEQIPSFASKMTDGSELFGLLSMTHRETTVFGSKRQGNMILSDAQMQSVTFTDHKLLGLSTTMKAARKNLEKVGFQTILEAVSRELAAKRTNLGELREHLERLHAMSEIFSGGTHSTNTYGHTNQEDFEKLKKVEQMLKESKDELVHARVGNETPEDWLEILIDHLRMPEKILQMERISLRLDWQNVLTEDSDTKADTISFAQCLLGEQSKRDAVFIAFPIKT